MAVKGSRGVLQIAIFSLLLVATAFGLTPLQNYVQAEFGRVRSAVISQLEESLGRPVGYSAISPSVFRSIRIDDFTVFRDESRTDTIARAERFRVYFSLWALLTDTPINAVTEVSIADARIEVEEGISDSSRRIEEGKLGLFRPAAEGEFPENLSVSATNVDLVIAAEGSVVSLGRAVAEVEFSDSLLSFDLRSAASYELPLTGEQIEGEIQLRGSVEEGFRRGSGFVEFPRIAYSQWELTNQAFAVRFDNQTLAIRKVRNRDPLEVSIDADLALGVVTGRVLAEGFVPNSVVNGGTPGGAVDTLLAASVDIDAELSYDLEREKASIAATHRFVFPRNPANIRLIEGRLEGGLDAFDGTLVARNQNGGRMVANIGKASPNQAMVALLDLTSFNLFDAPVTTGTVRMTGRPGGLTLRSDVLEIGAGTLYGTVIEGDQSQSVLSLYGETYLNPEETRGLTVDGQLTLGGPQRVEVNADLRRAPVADLLRLAQSPSSPAAGPSVLDSFVIDTAVTAVSEGGDFDIDAPFVSVYDESRPEDTFLYFSLIQGDEEVAVEGISASYAGMEFGGRIVVGDRQQGVVPVSMDLSHDGEQYRASGEYRIGGSFSLEGDHSTRVSVLPREIGGLTFSASVMEAPVKSLGEAAYLTARVAGSFRARDSWNARLQRLDLGNVSGPTGLLTLRARGQVGPGGGQLAPLVIDDGVEILAGSVSVTSDGDAGGAVVNGTLTSADETESLRVSGNFDPNGLAMNLQGSAVALRRLGIAGLRGQTDFAAEATGTAGDISVRGTVSIPEGQLAGESFTAGGRFTLAGENLRIQGVQLRRGENRLDVSRAVADLEQGSINVNARLTRGVGPAEKTTDIAVKYQRRAEDPFSAIHQVIDDPFSAEIQMNGIDVAGVSEREWLFDLRRTTSGATLRGAPENAVRGQISNAGDFRLVLTDPLPVRFQAAGTLAEGNVEATITRISAELPIVPPATTPEVEKRPGGRFRPLRGSISGSLRVVGPVNDPDLFGTLSAEAFEAEVPYVEGVVSASRVFVLFQEKTIQAERFFAGQGNAGANLEATLLLSRWGVDEYEILINTIGEEGLPIVQNFGPVAVDGHGLGTLRIYATPATTDVTGEIIAEETTITLITADEIEEREPRKITTVDLTVEAGRRLEFLWPSREVPIVRAFARAGDEIRLVSASEDESFALDGAISIRGGEIFYVNRSFYMRQGRIVFDEDEAGFDPVLSARAELREVGPRGPVRIFLIAEESPLSQFSPRLESSPPLTDDEIIALLGGAILEEGSTDVANLGSAVAVTSDVVTQFGIMSEFERQVREALNVDLFSVRTQVFQNIVIGSLEQPDVPLDTTAPSLGTYLDNTTVFLGKYLGSDLFLELLVELRARDPLDQDAIAIGGMEVDPEIGLEFDTPFFLLQWSFFPRTPETLFVADNTFEFSWQFSY